MSASSNTARDALAPIMASTASPTIVPQQHNAPAMIDSRNVYKISPLKTTIVAPQQLKQDIVKIRLTKDESGGLGYTKSIINPAQPPEDKPDIKTTPTKMSINLAQQPTLQLKTSQNKIVLVKMLPKLPQSGPQVVPVATQRSSLSPTTLALARSVQGLRSIPPGASPPSTTISAFTVAKTTEKQVSPSPTVESSPSLSPGTAKNLSTSSISLELNTSSKINTEAIEQPPVLEESIKVCSSEIPSDADQNGSVTTTSVKMSREMRILKASQSSSKILSEFIQDTSSSEKLRKRRRSRCDGEDSRSCGSVTPNSMKRCSISGRDEDELDDSKDGSTCGSKRAGMRSANAEFSLKQRKFLSSIHQSSDGSENSGDETDQQEAVAEPLRALSEVKENARSGAPVAPKPGWDKFCWRCKTAEPGLEPCAGCIRCYHPVCLKLNPAFFIVEKKWNCPECIKLNPPGEQGKEDGGKPSKDMLKIDSLTVSLKFAMKRIQMLKGSTILNSLDKDHFPNYDQYVTNHFDLAMLQHNVSNQKYSTTDAFMADVNWILHNASIYPHNNKLLPVAKALVKVCKQELNEIEACNECYFNANTCKMWFTEVCTKPHLLVWAKLKGFPFWPAKLMSVNSNQLVDVRFFGDHDRAWVPIKECMLFCEKDPNTKQQRRSNMAECMREADTYISKLKRKFGQFRYAEFRTQVEANKLDEHLEAMIPGVLKKVVETEDSQKAKLMLKIIKTADNFLSVSPIGSGPATTSTPKATPNLTPSSEENKPEKLDEPRIPDDSQSTSNKIKDESISIPEQLEDPMQNRKRKSSGPPEETKAEDILELHSPSIRRRSSRVSTAMGKLREESIRNSVTPEPLRCYTSKKRRDESPVPEPTDKEPKQDKIESVVIQRKSDSWKTVPATAKKLKVTSTSSEELPISEVAQVAAENTARITAPEPMPTAAVVTQKSAIVEQTTPEVSKSKEVALLPLAPSEIKTEISDEEPAEQPAPVAQEPVVESPVVNSTASSEPSTSNSSPEETPVNVPQQLLPIKIEPVSDDDSDENMADVGQGATSNQVLIRTNNRIMVKDINKLTTQMGVPRPNANAPNNNQQAIGVQVEKPKNVTPKAVPKVLPAAPQKVRRLLPNQQHITVNSNAPNRSATTTGNILSAPRNGNNMMHMVHIPHPIHTSSSDTASRVEITNGATGGPTVQPVRQQPSNCDTTSTPVESVPSGVTGPANVPSAFAGPSTAAPVAPTVEGQHMMSGFITPSLAAAVTETIVSTPPKLQSRPSGAIRSEGDCVYPSGAGPVSQILINNSYKMADFFRSVIEDTLADLSNNSGALESKVKVLELEIEKLKHCHQQEINKLKHNSDLVLCEMRKNMELEKTRIINEVRKQCDIERIRSVEDAKRKQWCVNCGKEALFYCCWNTSYCDYPCQQQHWGIHMSQCTQNQLNLPSTAIASKPTAVHQTNKVTAQHITTPKISTVQTLNLNGRSGLTIQPAQHQQQQQQLIINSTRGGAQLGKGQTFQRLMLNPVGTVNSAPYAIASSAPSKWSAGTTATLSTVVSTTPQVLGSGLMTTQIQAGGSSRPATSKFVIGLK